MRLTTSNSCIRLFISAHKLSTPTVFDGNSKELELRSDFMLLPRFMPAVRRRLNVGEALVSCTCRNTNSYKNFVVTQTLKSYYIKAGMESMSDVWDNTKMRKNYNTKIWNIYSTRVKMLPEAPFQEFLNLNFFNKAAVLPQDNVHTWYQGVPHSACAGFTEAVSLKCVSMWNSINFYRHSHY